MQLNCNTSPALRRCVQALCLLLLLAQQTAFTHGAWHAATAGDSAEADHGHRDKRRHEDGERALCAFDFAMTQVLGLESGSAPPIASERYPPEFCARAVHGRLKAEAVPAVSRGPPSLL